MSGVVSYKEETARLDSLLVHAGAEAMAPPQRGTRGQTSYGRPTRAAAVTQVRSRAANMPSVFALTRALGAPSGARYRLLSITHPARL